MRSLRPGKSAVQMIDRDVEKCWFVFPWEAVAGDETLVQEALSVPERLA